MKYSIRNSSFGWGILLAFTLIAHRTGHGQVGSSGLAFLKLGTSGRADAMGEAMSALSAGADALTYNPAGLLLNGGADFPHGVALTYKAWIEETDLEHLGAFSRLDGSQAIGLSLTMMSIPEIEVRDRPGEAIGTFSARSFQVGATYARLLSGEISAGITLRYLYEKLYIDQASGVGVDAGLRWKTPLDSLTVGAAVANLGSMSALRTAKSRLPTLLRLGPAYSLCLEEPALSASFALDAQYLFPEQRGHLVAGAEIGYDRTFLLRAGYQFGTESRGFSAGLGIQYELFVLDYAYIPLRNGLGGASTFTLGLRF